MGAEPALDDDHHDSPDNEGGGDRHQTEQVLLHGVAHDEPDHGHRKERDDQRDKEADGHGIALLYRTVALEEAAAGRYIALMLLAVLVFLVAIAWVLHRAFTR